MKSGNPVLRSDTFDAVPAGERMTVNGTINKTAMMLALVMITAIYTWGRFTATNDPASIMPLVWTGAIGGFIFCLITVFKTRVGCLHGAYLRAARGSAGRRSVSGFQCRLSRHRRAGRQLTFGVMAVMLLAYRSGLIQATEKFKVGVIAATGGIALLYLVSMVMSMFGKPIGFIHEGGTFGILFSGFVVVIAALNLILDFDIIKQGVDRGAPKHMEWYGAFALTVTLVWLYLEILRLLGKLRK